MFSSVKFVGNFWHCYSLKCTQQLFVKLELIFRCFQAHSKCSVVGTTASLGAYHSPGTFEWTSGRQCLHGWSVGLANPPQLTWGNGWYSFLWKKKKTCTDFLLGPVEASFMEFAGLCFVLLGVMNWAIVFSPLLQRLLHVLFVMFLNVPRFNQPSCLTSPILQDRWPRPASAMVGSNAGTKS